LAGRKIQVLILCRWRHQPSVPYRAIEKHHIMKLIRNIFQLFCTGALVALVNYSLPGRAASTNVIVGPVVNGVESLSFSPAVVNINIGDSVIWTWQSSFHSTTSTNTPPLWDSGVHNTPFIYTNTFTTNGFFAYICTIHHFAGDVIVQAPVPLAVSILNPADGTVFSEPANVTIQASTADVPGTVTNVQFLVGSTILTNETTAPFSAMTGQLLAGGYVLSAIAADDQGAQATNAVNITVVTPVQPAITTPQQSSVTNFQFSYAVNPGLSYVIQRSTNLLSNNWISLATNLATVNPATFTDSNATVNPGFYRVGLLPNP
jgi:plastocyanin